MVDATYPPVAEQRDTSANTPLRIPYGNKEAAQQLGARYTAGAWYAPPGVDLTEFESKGWL
jgi:DNA topoisomerase-3